MDHMILGVHGPHVEVLDNGPFILGRIWLMPSDFHGLVMICSASFSASMSVMYERRLHATVCFLATIEETHKQWIGYAPAV